MSFLEILLIAVGLAMDAFAVTLAATASGRSTGRRAAFRLSFHFGLFQLLMPILGWLVGRGVASLISTVGVWIAFGLLLLVGWRMVRSGLSGSTEVEPGDSSRGWSLVLLSVATSIDALAIGFSLALLEVRIWYPCVVIGLVTAALSLIAVKMGHLLARTFGSRMEVVGGVILMLIGTRILLTHISS